MSKDMTKMDDTVQTKKPLSATLDTNILGHRVVKKIEQVVKGLPINLAHVSVTARELEVTDIIPRGQRILETGVWGESRWGEAVWGGDYESNLLETLLVILSNGSFPCPDKRKNLTHSQRNMLRDAMILLAHVRSGRGILVTNDKKAFIGKKDDALRQKLETLCSTKIMNLDEYCAYCDGLK